MVGQQGLLPPIAVRSELTRLPVQGFDRVLYSAPPTTARWRGSFFLSVDRRHVTPRGHSHVDPPTTRPRRPRRPLLTGGPCRRASCPPRVRREHQAVMFRTANNGTSSFVLSWSDTSNQTVIFFFISGSGAWNKLSPGPRKEGALCNLFPRLSLCFCRHKCLGLAAEDHSARKFALRICSSCTSLRH